MSRAPVRRGAGRDRRTPRAASAAPPADPGPRRARDVRPGRGAGLAALVMLGLVLAALGWWLRRHGPAAAADPLAAMPAPAAYDTALALAARNDPGASLPYFRRAMRGIREDFWQIHSNYASALYNLTLRIESRRGVDVAAVRSTAERTAMVREAIAQLERARALAVRPADRAVVLGLTGRLTHVYGLPWETFVAWREAQFADPANAALGRRADLLQFSLEHPTASNGASDEP